MNYDSIIDHPHHVSKRHSQMSLENRAAQFAPFKALNGYDDAIDETGEVNEYMVLHEVCAVDEYELGV